MTTFDNYQTIAGVTGTSAALEIDYNKAISVSGTQAAGTDTATVQYSNVPSSKRVAGDWFPSNAGLQTGSFIEQAPRGVYAVRLAVAGGTFVLHTSSTRT